MGSTGSSETAPGDKDNFQDATAIKGKRFTCHMHGPGKPSRREPRGDAYWSFVVGEEGERDIRRTLEIHSPSKQKGRPQLWCGTECMTPKRVSSDDTTAMEPLNDDDIDSVVDEQLREARQSLGEVREDIIALRKERQSLVQEIANIREERAKEVIRTTDMLERVVKSTGDLMDRRTKEADDVYKREQDKIATIRADAATAMRDAEEMQRKAAAMTEEALAAYGRGMVALGEQSQVVLETRTRLDAHLRRDILAETFRFLEKASDGWAKSPAGDAIAFTIAVAIAERTAAKKGEQFNRDDALAAMMMNGRLFKERLQELQSWAGVTEGREAKAVILALQYLTNQTELEVLVHFVTAAS